MRAVERANKSGVITEAQPKMTKMFIILLPTTLPIVISALPFKEAAMLTAASGALVPMATIVRPITSCGMPNLAAMPAAPSTNQSAPLPSSTKPRANKANCNNKSIIFSFRSIPKYKKRDLLQQNYNKVSLLTHTTGLPHAIVLTMV